MSIDWSKAPEGATHFQPSNRRGRLDRYFKDDFKSVFVPSIGDGWIKVSRTIDRIDLADAIPRPTSTENPVSEQNQPVERKHSHYFKDVSGVDQIDVYAVLRLFEVTDPCLQHIIKKALCAGKRGAKDWAKDVQEIADTAQRLIELEQSK